ncbi:MULTISPECIES: hypothetical protein [Vibrio]|uniref:hypothetical protein n=1 Tax=Vibrio TaxID=662 RepID=UPI00078CE87E|nr:MULTISPECIES: hypothetical protein [Vibrio]BAU70774.1 hypothetical protein [Vibrio sp. 04Ya108]BBM67657.1 hypothetical protein VA249_43030 [Vibrio alfacsensis]BCN27139.1 hypothetical protein VYA_43310 [Vibrio alfacsensis]
MNTIIWTTAGYLLISLFYFIKVFREGDSGRVTLHWWEWLLLLPFLTVGLLLNIQLRFEQGMHTVYIFLKRKLKKSM